MAGRERIWSSLACTAHCISIFQGVMFNSRYFLLNKEGYWRVISLKPNTRLGELQPMQAMRMSGSGLTVCHLHGHWCDRRALRFLTDTTLDFFSLDALVVNASGDRIYVTACEIECESLSYCVPSMHGLKQLLGPISIRVSTWMRSLDS